MHSEERRGKLVDIVIIDGGNKGKLLTKLMDSNNSGDRAKSLETLVQELRLYNERQKIPRTETETFGCQDSSSVAVSSTKRAAVLVCLFEGNDGDIRVFLTKRSSILSSHSGEVALPGGKREETDADDVDTALREAKEEIGLDSSLVNVVTVLQPYVTRIGITVVPVIGILHDRKAFIPAPSAAEVDAIFDAPLEMFLKDENRREEEREWMGDKYCLHFFEYEAEGSNYVIWALTAGILIHVASVVYQRPPEFLERKPKFWSGVANKK